MAQKERTDCEAMLSKTGFTQHKDSKGKVNADNYVADAGDRRQVISWSPKAAKVVGRDLTDDEARRGVVYTINAEGEIEADPAKQTPAGQAYVSWADKDAAPVASSGMVAQQAPAKTAPTQALAVADKQDVAKVNNFMREIGGNTYKELAVELNGNRYATVKGRWFLFYALGLKLKKMTVEHVCWAVQKSQEWPENYALVKCVMVLDDGTTDGQYYEAYADASDKNCKLADVKLALDRMAETRAVGRCLGYITAGGFRTLKPDQRVVEDLKRTASCSAEEMTEGFDTIDAEGHAVE